MATNYKQLADQLIKALQDSVNSGLASIDVQRRNFGEDINNKANKSGTLYSTAPAYIRGRADASKFLPAKVDLRQKANVGTISIKNTLLDTQNQINSMHEAARQLDAINSDYFAGLLT